MKKTIMAFTLFVVMVPLIACAQAVISNSDNIQVSVDKTTSTVGTPIALQLRFVPAGRGCGGSVAYDRIVVKQNGTAIATVYDSAPVNGQEYVYSSVSVSSGTSGDANLTLDASCFDGVDYMAPVTIAAGKVTFTPAVSPVTTPATVSAPKQTVQVPTPATTPVPPSSPVVESIVSNNSFTLKDEDIALPQDAPKVFSGKTIPNGIVHLYFHSDPFEDTTTANAEGIWTYELKQDIGEGSHTMELAVTDPATNLTSEKSKPVAFTLVKGVSSSNNQDEINVDPPRKSYLWWYVGSGILLLTSSGVIGFYLWKKKSTKKISSVS